MAYAHPDEHFFIESDEPQSSTRGFRDTAKMLARSRQETIACELSRLAGEEYLGDIMTHMRHMEACCDLVPSGLLLIFLTIWR